MKTLAIEFIFILYKKQRTVAKTKNGAKGISWFFVFLIKSIKIPTTAPIQKERRSAEIPAEIPRSQPIPNANFTSPKPSHFPFERNQSKKSGNATKGPAHRADKNPVPRYTKTEFIKAKAMN